MSCAECPHCQEKGGTFEVTESGLSLSEKINSSDLDNEYDPNILKLAPKRRGPSKEYSAFFEQAWRVYGRKEEKWPAYLAWIPAAKSVGGEETLFRLITVALKWQRPLYDTDGWKYARYFERYLRKRKWEDEPPPLPVRTKTPVALDAQLKATDANLARLRVPEAALPTADQLAELRASRGKP